MTTSQPSSSVPRVGNGSLTSQTTRALLDAILDRGFPGNRLPPEPELSEQLGVSRTTLRAALQSLERLGVLSRTPGRGTIVRAHVGQESIVLQRLIGFRGLLEERYKVVRVRQRYWVEDHMDEDVAQTLNIRGDAPAIVSAKTFFADGNAAIHIADHIPLESLAPELQQELLAGGKVPAQDSIFEFSRSWPGREIDHTVVSLVPSVAPIVNTTLDLEDGMPVLRLLETHYNLTGQPVASSDVHVDDRFVRFNVIRHD